MNTSIKCPNPNPQRSPRDLHTLVPATQYPGTDKLAIPPHAGSKKSPTHKFPRTQPPNLLLIFPRTMEPEDHYNHHDTSTKAKVQGAIEFCEQMNIPYFKSDVFKTFRVSKHQGYQMLQSEASAHQQNNNSELISDKDIWEMKRVLKLKSFEAKALT